MRDLLADFPKHQQVAVFSELIAKCQENISNCNDRAIDNVVQRLSNDFSYLLLVSDLEALFNDALCRTPPGSTLHNRISHAKVVLSFAQGVSISSEESLRAKLDMNDLSSQRSLAAQVFMVGSGSTGISLFLNYSQSLGERFLDLLATQNVIDKTALESIRQSHKGDALYSTGYSLESESLPRGRILQRSPSSDEIDEYLLSLLLAEAQGVVRGAQTAKLQDLRLSVSEIRMPDAKLRFRLGVGLAKLGLFELSLRHVALSATPWEAPLHRFRAKLVLPAVHASVRSLAQAIEAFVRQAESILLQAPAKSSLMQDVCNSPNEAALALQSLPLLHLAGFAAPRDKLELGHSPVALPRLLSDVFVSMCPPSVVGNSLMYHQKQRKASGDPLIIAVVAGSFDGLAGTIIVGMLEEYERWKLLQSPDALEWTKLSRPVELVAMCYPTARDETTDRAGVLFDRNVNLSPINKTEALERIRAVQPDFVLFADLSADSRVFALAHERLAAYQAALWGWGGDAGIPTIDFYVSPFSIWSHASCPSPSGVGRITPFELLQEQVLQLEGLPALPLHTHSLIQGEGLDNPRRRDELSNLLWSRYLLPHLNSTHMYLFPGSPRHLHPEFDAAIAVLLRTDPFAMIILAIPQSGRDAVPTTHIAVRHDLMHPTAPPAAVARLRERLEAALGADNARRVRVLPPLPRRMFDALQREVVAVLDPFPVGMHVQLLQAMRDGVPVVSAPSLQECTNSHADSLAAELQIGPYHHRLQTHHQSELDTDHDSSAANVAGAHHGVSVGLLFSWPASPEEYAVMAMRLQWDAEMRESFVPNAPSSSQSLPLTPSSQPHALQLIEFVEKIAGK